MQILRRQHCDVVVKNRATETDDKREQDEADVDGRVVVRRCGAVVLMCAHCVLQGVVDGYVSSLLFISVRPTWYIRMYV